MIVGLVLVVILMFREVFQVTFLYAQKSFSRSHPIETETEQKFSVTYGLQKYLSDHDHRRSHTQDGHRTFIGTAAVT